MTKQPILELKELNVALLEDKIQQTEIIKNIDIKIPKGEIVGIVGESGSGKSMTMRAIMDILPENAQRNFSTFTFEGEPVSFAKASKRLPISMIFQDPMTSLNPLRKIGYHLIEVIRRQQKLSKKAAKKLAIQELEKVGLTNPEKRMTQYPHELSGGMRQRVMIAMALLVKPKLLIADEPTTALDVTIQAQILTLIQKLQKEEDLTVVLVTHDFGIVAGMCQSVKVMYQGEIVEEGTTDEIFYQSQHPYTKELLKAVPTVEKGQRLYAIQHQLETGEPLTAAQKEFRQLSETHRVQVAKERRA